ncbi:MAG: CHAD domain-containing protein [Caldilineaceae bacterium]
MTTHSSPQVQSAAFAITQAADFTQVLNALVATKAYSISLPADKPEERWELYFDTPDYRLLRRGLTVCLHRAAEDMRLTIQLEKERKGTAPAQRRQLAGEVNLTVQTKTWLPDAWPSELGKDLLSELPAIHQLEPKLLLHVTASLQTVAERRAKEPPTATATPVAVLAVTTLTVSEPTPDLTPSASLAAFVERTNHDNAAVQLYELSVVPLTDDLRAVRRVSRRLRRNPLTEELTGSRFERALLAINKHAPQADSVTFGVQPQMHIAEACRLILRAQLMTMLMQEAGVRWSSDIDYVHEMRVAIRRSRAAAKLYGSFFRRRALRPYREKLRKTGRLLGAVRDLDVAIAKAKRRARQGEKKDKAQKKIIEEWQRQRQQAHNELVTWLDSKAYRHFVTEFATFCHNADKGSKVAHHHSGEAPPLQQVRHVVPSLILHQFAVVRGYEVLFASDQAVDYGTIHALRIDCKYLRYNLEFVAHLLGKEGELLIDQLKQLQDLLGDLNDAVVSYAMLEEEGKDNQDEAYRQSQAVLIAKLTTQVAPAHQQFVASENRRHLFAALACL